MRIIVFFDLPVTSRAKRKAANDFRRFLVKDGYIRLQLSVSYDGLCVGRDMLENTTNGLDANLPKEGSVRCLEVTEKQFVAMKVLLGDKDNARKTGECTAIFAVLA